MKPDKTKNSQNVLALEAYIRSLMKVLNGINMVGFVVGLVLLFATINEVIKPSPNDFLFSERAGTLVLILMAWVIVWILSGWICLVKILRAIKRLPAERATTMFEVVRHLHPTIYIFVLVNICIASNLFDYLLNTAFAFLN
jgi:hypothetical protein